MISAILSNYFLSYSFVWLGEDLLFGSAFGRKWDHQNRKATSSQACGKIAIFQVHSSIIFGLMSVAFCHRKVVKSRFALAADTIEFQLGFAPKAELQTKIAQLYDVCVEQQVVWPFCRFQ